MVNMRGVKDTGAAFIVPTFLFVGTLLTADRGGLSIRAYAGGRPSDAGGRTAAGASGSRSGRWGLWMLIKAFASGCAAMTGVEAVSNGVMAFGEPRAKNAQQTLTIIIAILIVLLFGMAYLAQALPNDGDGPGREQAIRAC